MNTTDLQEKKITDTCGFYVNKPVKGGKMAMSLSAADRQMDNVRKESEVSLVIW